MGRSGQQPIIHLRAVRGLLLPGTPQSPPKFENIPSVLFIKL